MFVCLVHRFGAFFLRQFFRRLIKLGLLIRIFNENIKSIEKKNNRFSLFDCSTWAHSNVDSRSNHPPPLPPQIISPNLNINNSEEKCYNNWINMFYAIKNYILQPNSNTKSYLRSNKMHFCYIYYINNRTKWNNNKKKEKIIENK